MWGMTCSSLTTRYSIVILKPLVKVKAIPLEAWTGPERFRSLRLPDYKIIGTGIL
jgi:hypothetical protein